MQAAPPVCCEFSVNSALIFKEDNPHEQRHIIPHVE